MTEMIVYKDIDEERLGDAPFIGALIIAPSCNRNCKGCFNQHLKELENKFDTAANIIERVKNNPIHEGIILGGLEWTEEPFALVELTETALREGLLVMIYTSMSAVDFADRFPTLMGKDVWVKCEPYDERFKSDVYFSHGVKLATTNQEIIYLGDEIMGIQDRKIRNVED